MPETLPSQELADRLEALIRVMDPVRSAPPASVHQSWDQLCAGLDTLLSEGASPGPYREEAAALAELVQHGQPSRELSALRSRREEIQQLYFGLCQRIREETGQERRPLRPSNLRRSLTHVLSGVGAVLLVQHLLTPTGCILTAGAFAVFGWGCEFFRRRSEAVNRALMAFFGPVAHAHESEQVNSATWYATALTILAIFGTKDVIILALITLAIGDPVAGWIGRRWGRIRIGTRSLEGSLAFTVSATIAGLGLLQLYYPQLSLAQGLAMAAAAGAGGALGELVSDRLDDNFTIPLAAGLSASLVVALGL